MASRTGMFLKESQRLELIKELTSKGELKPGVDISNEVLENLQQKKKQCKPCESSSGSSGGEQQVQQEASFGTGCLACGEDDDHANLLLCEACNDEYHTYCLDPPLRSVPTGDWFCDRCKMPMEDDGLDSLVCALPPTYTKRFGEVCWAQGGVGFGWWPAFIYDPRFTVGSARQLAQKHLGKRHLIYFFECHDAPFTVLPDSKITYWEDGMTDEYYLGRTAKASGKAKLKLFEQALQAAIVENGKPITMRMNWNHTEQPQILPPPAALNTTANINNNGQQQQNSSSNKKSKKKDSNKGKKRQHDQQLSSSNSNNNKKQKSTITTRRRISDKKQKFGFISTDSPDSSSVEEGGGGGGGGGGDNGTSPHPPRHHQYASRRVFSKGGVPMEGIASAADANSGRAAVAIPDNIDKNTSTTTAATQIESSEDGELICKLIKKCDGVDGSGGSGSKKQQTKLINIGFVKLKSRKFSTFADARIAIQEQLVLPDCGLPHLRSSSEGGGGGAAGWNFFVPNLGPVSSKQESNLGPMFTFMKQTTTDTNLGSGYWNHPLKVLIVDSPTHPSSSMTSTTTTAVVAAATTRVSTTSNSSSSAAAAVSSSTSTTNAITQNDGHKNNNNVNDIEGKN